MGAPSSTTRRTRGRGALLGAALLALAAGALPLAAQTEALVLGTVSYEKVPVSLDGLALGRAVLTPAAGIRVELVHADDGAVLATGFTDADGRYQLQHPGRGGRVQVRAVAATENARVVAASGRRPYALTSPPLRAAAGRVATHDLLARDADRASGPFNIARALWLANSLIRTAQPAIVMPVVEVRWDTAYAGGTFFRSSEKVAYINGRRGSDSDEFDDHVIIHEYAHFLMAMLSSEGSPGGDHGVGEMLDPRLAWSEGWADFFAAAVMGDGRYVDTGVRAGRQAVLVETNLEEDVHRDDRPGIWSEHSVGSILWDLFDDAPEPADSLAIGFAPIWAVFSDELRKEPDAYLLTFVNALARRGVPASGLQRLLAARSIVYPDGRDAFARRLDPGVAAIGTVDSRTALRSNLLRASSHYWFMVPSPTEVTVTMKITGARNPRRADLDLVLFDGKGNQVARSDEVNGVGASERISRRLDPGYYRAEVRSWSGGGRLSDEQAHQGSYRLLVEF